MSDYSSEDIVKYSISGDGARVKEAIHGALADKVMKHLEAKKAEVAQSMFGRLRGKVKNTMQQTFFVGPSKKDYQFTFDLIARNRKDSEAMSTIANRFQYFSNPGLSGQGNFWTYPEVVRYFFMERVGDDFRQIDVLSSLGNGVKNKVYESKACFITSVSIEYGDDDYLLFSSKDGGRGVGKMKLTLALKEVEYFSKEDYRRSTDPEI